MSSNASKKPSEKEKGKGMGLGDLSDLSGLMSAPESVPGQSGPLILPMSVVDEDPGQPRTADNPGFSPEKIAEIGATIKERGVKTPISVRENPDMPGRYLINDGARRYRGTQWAEKDAIPAFIDNDFIPDDQVVANIQREGHTPMEIAQLIAARINQGKKKSEIAKAWGKSPAYITHHSALLNLPPVLEEAFQSGRVTDVTLVSELVNVNKKAPDDLAEWLDDPEQEITRGSVKLFREFLDEKSGSEGGGSGGSGGTNEEEEAEGSPPSKSPKQKTPPDPDALKKAIVVIKHDERIGRLITNRRPEAEGYSWIKYDDDGHEVSVDLGTVSLVAILEA